MIDIVIPLGTGSTHKNIELKYTLASIKKWLTGYRNIYIVGEDPGFVGDFIHIPAKDHGWNTQDNIRRKIEIACAIPELSENFFFTNDDHTYLAPMDVNNIPNWADNDLDLAWRRKRKIGSYKSALENTKVALEEKKFATYHFDIHTPIIYNKVAFPKVMAMYAWKSCRWGYVIKSLYANTMMLNWVAMPDMMIGFEIQDTESIARHIGERFMFAYNDQGLNSHLLSFLASKFPDVDNG